jgi:hypothetical protein
MSLIGGVYLTTVHPTYTASAGAACIANYFDGVRLVVEVEKLEAQITPINILDSSNIPSKLSELRPIVLGRTGAAPLAVAAPRARSRVPAAPRARSRVLDYTRL